MEFTEIQQADPVIRADPGEVVVLVQVLGELVVLVILPLRRPHKALTAVMVQVLVVITVPAVAVELLL